MNTSSRIPAHIAIIMDGNGRWAKRRFLPRNVGHRQGAEALRTTIKACAELGIRYLTAYTFSTENWKRPKEEVSFLMGFLKEMLIKETPELHKQNVILKCLGDLSELPEDVQQQIKISENQTQTNSGLQLNLMINYGSRREIIQAIQHLIAHSKNPKDITEDLVSQAMYTQNIPDPDILIRTGGDVRISNYLLWQIAYSECFFLDTLWPDFNKKILVDVLAAFEKRDRRYGGLNG